MFLNEMQFEQLKLDRERDFARASAQPRPQLESSPFGAHRAFDHRDRRLAGRRAAAQAGSIPMRVEPALP